MEMISTNNQTMTQEQQQDKTMKTDTPKQAVIENSPPTYSDTQEQTIVNTLLTTFDNMGIKDDGINLIDKIKEDPDIYTDDKRKCVQDLARYYIDSQPPQDIEFYKNAIKDGNARITQLEQIVRVIIGTLLPAANPNQQAIRDLFLGESTRFDILTDNANRTRSHITEFITVGCEPYSFLDAAVVSGNINVVKNVYDKLLINKTKLPEFGKMEALLDATNGIRPIYRAAYTGHIDIVRYLIDIGASVHNMAFHVPDTPTGREIEKLLCSVGADPKRVEYTFCSSTLYNMKIKT
jgi:hypothetical protein